MLWDGEGFKVVVTHFAASANIGLLVKNTIKRSYLDEAETLEFTSSWGFLV